MCHCIETCQPQPVAAAGRTVSTVVASVARHRKTSESLRAGPEVAGLVGARIGGPSYPGAKCLRKHPKAPARGR
jgi:hypothetical protein